MNAKDLNKAFNQAHAAKKDVLYDFLVNFGRSVEDQWGDLPFKGVDILERDLIYRIFVTGTKRIDIHLDPTYGTLWVCGLNRSGETTGGSYVTNTKEAISEIKDIIKVWKHEQN